MVFFEICLFECFCLFPLWRPAGRRGFVFHSNELNLYLFFNLYNKPIFVGPVPAGPDLGCWAPAWARKTLKTRGNYGLF